MFRIDINDFQINLSVPLILEYEDVAKRESQLATISHEDIDDILDFLCRKALVLNGLGFTHRAWYLTSWFFRDKPVARLIGQGVKPKPRNDDTLGRALDAIYPYGVEKLYAQLASLAAKRWDLACGFAPLDSTGFQVDGQYHSNEEAEEGVVPLPST